MSGKCLFNSIKNGINGNAWLYNRALFSNYRLCEATLIPYFLNVQKPKVFFPSV